jgi:glycosyltransferase involved in cell wall biosynthesis
MQVKILFHYHIPVYKNDQGELFVPSYLGVFLEGLALTFDQLTIVGYELNENSLDSFNFKLVPSNILFESLGKPTSVHSRIFKLFFEIHRINRLIKDCDVFILRAPTPFSLILPFLRLRKKLLFYLVGDYSQGLYDAPLKPIRKFFKIVFSLSVEFVQRQIVRNKYYLANSPKLIDVYSEYSLKGKLIRTTTLTNNDMYIDSKVISKNPKILFTGGISHEKGVFNILEACVILQESGVDLSFYLAGMDSTVNGLNVKCSQALINQAKGTKMEGKVHYHGLRKVGDDLNSIYRACDIYVIASLSDFEGFPRTIWEAMANGLPVIASKVGGIPFYLKDMENAILISPKSVDEIVYSIKLLLANTELANKIKQEGNKIARLNTLENQMEEISHFIKSKYKAGV